jgi:hypothetical protein
VRRRRRRRRQRLIDQLAVGAGDILVVKGQAQLKLAAGKKRVVFQEHRLVGIEADPGAERAVGGPQVFQRVNAALIVDARVAPRDALAGGANRTGAVATHKDFWLRRADFDLQQLAFVTVEVDARHAVAPVDLAGRSA